MVESSCLSLFGCSGILMQENNNPNGVPYSEEEFEELDRGKEIEDSDKFYSDILASENVEVSGVELKNFMGEFQLKVQSYLDNPFVKVFKYGFSQKKIKNIKKYVLGAAICKHYRLNVKRFIEAQFYFHDRWKGSAPNIAYVTSAHSSWNSVGRYTDYCKLFSSQIDYFGNGEDNIDPSFRARKARTNKMPIPRRLVQIYDQIIEFQMEKTGRTKEEVLVAIASPGNISLPKQYLEEIPEYIQLKKHNWRID